MLLESDLGKKMQYAKDLSQKEELQETLGIWLEFFRNAFLSCLGLQKKWVVLKKDISLEKIKVILKNIQTTIYLVSSTNANKKLALEILLMEI